MTKLIAADDEELGRLIVQYLDSSLSPTELDSLNTWLDADERARAYFVHICIQSRICAETLVNRFHEEDVTQVVVSPSDEVSQIPVQNIFDEQLGEAKQFASNDSLLKGSQSPRLVVGSLGQRFGVLAASPITTTLLVAIVCYGAFAILAWNLRSGTLPSATHDDAAVAILSSDSDVRWSRETVLKDGNSGVRRGESLNLDSGIVQLELKSGATLNVEGPAVWSVDGENHATLKSGRIVATIPASAVDFAVSTPTAEVVDLGTEFGVEVDAAGQTNVEVIVGKVEVGYGSAGTQIKSRQTVQLTVGAARRFSSRADGSVAVTPLEPWVDKTALGKKLSGANSELPAETKYAAAVLADKPLGYWRFSDTDGHKAVDASGHENHGEYLGFVSSSNPGICPTTRDRSIRFLGKQYRGYVRINDFELPASCTVELWVRSATPTWNTYGWFLSCAERNGFQICPLDSGRDWHVYVHNSLNETPDLGPHQGPAEIADRFHHFVVSYDATTDRGTLYCDGLPVHDTPNLFGDKPRRKTAVLTFFVGCVDLRTGFEAWGEGSVDELAIYGEVLSADAVKRHYEAAGYSTTNNSNP